MINDLVQMLSSETGLSPSSVLNIIHTAPDRYKFYKIDKKSGGKRTIAHPARELKMLQRAFLLRVLSRLPVHSCATAYVSGINLVDNVAPHAANNGPIIKLDFTNFFPSIRGQDWISYARNKEIFSNSYDLHLSQLLLFCNMGDGVLRLSIGAPTSPALSNVLMYDIDEQIFNKMSERYVSYTRYADDMTFSAPRTGFMTTVISDVAKIIRNNKYPKLALNGAKTRTITQKFNRTVTGLVISNQGQVTVGQHRKRHIRVGVYKFLRGELSPAETQKLAGVIAFVCGVEVDYKSYLEARYGENTISSIMRFIGQKRPKAP